MAGVSGMPAKLDPRLRGQVKLDALRGIHLNVSNRIRIHHLLALLLTKTLVASAAWLARQWLLMPQIDVDQFQAQMLGRESIEGVDPSVVHSPASIWAVATVAMSLAALLLMFVFRVWRWQVGWSEHTIRHLSLLGCILFLQLLLWLVALKYLGATTTIIFTQFCEVWMRDIQVGRRWKSSGSVLVLVSLAVSFISAAASGSALSLRRPYDDTLDEVAVQTLAMTAHLQDHVALPDLIKGYASLAVYAILSVEMGRVMFTAAKDVGGRRRAMVLGMAFAAAILLPLSMLGTLVGLHTLPATLTPYHKVVSQDALEISHMAAYLLLAVGVLISDMLVTLTLESYVTLFAHAAHAWPMVVFAAFAIGFAVFEINVSWVQITSALCVGFGLMSVLKRSPLYLTAWYRHATLEEQRAAAGPDTDTTAVSEAVVLLYRTAVQLRRLVGEILVHHDSRRIFTFLCLNLAFMGVQLVWGVWTNSLGLISDAIHMLFDCAAIFMGLVASVMASWKTDASFPYGYKRVETLSGFANGIFLVLISVFILFEAVQRIIEPPVMSNMKQLLIVSTLGLFVNLFGMFAMGHHHHGHGHGHCHHHDHGHSHNMLGLYLHVMADTLGSIGVIISTVLIHYYKWTGFDPIASLLIGLMILSSVVPLVIDSGRILCLDMGAADTSNIELALSKVGRVW